MTVTCVYYIVSADNIPVVSLHTQKIHVQIHVMYSYYIVTIKAIYS